MKNTIKTLVLVMVLVLALAAFTGCELLEKECTHEGTTELIPSVIPTCTETGMSLGTKCTKCGEVILEPQVTPVRGHDKTTLLNTTADCLNAGVETWNCGFCGEDYDVEVEAYGHGLVEVEAKAPTCTEDGYNAHKACEYCDYTEGKEVVEATGHSLVDVEAKAANCTEDGYNAHKACENCDYTEGKEVAEAHGHDYDHVVTAPTCTEAGYTTNTCVFCDDSYTDAEVEATGHVLVDVEAKEATCAAAGYTAHKACENCDYTEGKEVVAATGAHADEDGDYKCDTCKTTVLPADGTALTVEQAIAIGNLFEHDKYSTQKYYITGIVASVPNATYGNFDLTDGNGNTILIYGLYSADGNTRYDAMTSKPQKGDEITVYTVLGKYSNAAQSKNAWMDEFVQHTEHVWVEATCTAPKTCSLCDLTEGEMLEHTYVDGTCSGCGKVEGAAALVNATLSFSSKNNRTELSTSKQVWTQNGVTVTNNKASSTSNVADYAGPARFYAASNLVVEGVGISKIVFDCNSASYATALKNSIGTVEGATVTVSSDKVTVVFNTPVDSFTIAKLTAQVRMDSITIN